MLFHIQHHDSVKNCNPNHLRDVVCELVRAHRKGLHLASFDRAFCAWARENITLSNDERATLDRLEKEYTQTGGLRRSARRYIEVLFEDMPSQLPSSAIRMTVSTLAYSRALERSILNVENARTDGQLLTFLMENLKDKFQIVQLSMDVANGGGDEVGSVAQQEIINKRIVLTVVDGDIKSPASPNSTKIQKVKELIDACGWPPCDVVVPPCHETENIVPLGVLISLPCARGHKSNSILIDVLDKEDKNFISLSESYIVYFDFKNGCCPIRREKMKKVDREWLEERIELCGHNPMSFAVAGYGNNIVPQLLDSGSSLAELRKIIRSHGWLEIFGEFLAETSWFFAATPSLRT